MYECLRNYATWFYLIRWLKFRSNDEKRNRDRVEILQDIRAIRREVVEMIRRIEKSQDY